MYLEIKFLLQNEYILNTTIDILCVVFTNTTSIRVRQFIQSNRIEGIPDRSDRFEWTTGIWAQRIEWRWAAAAEWISANDWLASARVRDDYRRVEERSTADWRISPAGSHLTSISTPKRNKHTASRPFPFVSNISLTLYVCLSTTDRREREVRIVEDSQEIQSHIYCTYIHAYAHTGRDKTRETEGHDKTGKSFDNLIPNPIFVASKVSRIIAYISIQ